MIDLLLNHSGFLWSANELWELYDEILWFGVMYFTLYLIEAMKD